MKAEIKQDEVISKVFNNNIVLVNSNEEEKILFDKGIGFGKKPGYKIPKGTKIDKIFTIADGNNRANFNNIVDKVDNEFLAICEEAIYEVSERINQDLNESIHIGLIDHLYFSIKRIKNNEIIENPFLVEIETLYGREFTLATMVADKVANYANITMPEDEIGFIALHIHSAINNGKISNTLKNSYLGNTIVEHVEDRLGIEIDRKSLDYARFLTHIKFALQRIMENSPLDNELTKIIRKTYKESFNIAREVAEIIEEELELSVDDNEIAFLTVHIERFKSSIKYN